MVVDEVMTARLDHGGLQRRYGVRPDIVTLGKILGGGFPIGAFGASSDVMALFDVRRPGAAMHGGSFNNDVFSMSCGVVALTELLTEAEMRRMNDDGDRLRLAIQHVFDDLALPLVMTGIGSTCALHVGTSAPTSFRRHPLVDRLRRHFHLALNCGDCWVAGRAMIATSLVTDDRQVAHLIDTVTAWAETNESLVRAVSKEVAR
jgi:glutamate-1-semialdehyde 2,1-aminomutase